MKKIHRKIKRVQKKKRCGFITIRVSQEFENEMRTYMKKHGIKNLSRLMRLSIKRAMKSDISEYLE